MLLLCDLLDHQKIGQTGNMMVNMFKPEHKNQIEDFDILHHASYFPKWNVASTYANCSYRSGLGWIQ